MDPRPTSVESPGGMRGSPARPTPPGRLQLLVGAYFVFAAALLIVPGLLVAERQLRRRLTDARLASFASIMRGLVSGVETRATAAESTSARFSTPGPPEAFTLGRQTYRVHHRPLCDIADAMT